MNINERRRASLNSRDQYRASASVKIGVHPSVLEHDQVSPQIGLRGAVLLSGERRILACLVEQVILILRVQCRPGLGHALHERWKPAAFHCLPNAAGDISE